MLEDAVQHATWDTIRTDDARERELQAAVIRDLNQEAREMRAMAALREAKASAGRSGVARNAAGRRANRQDEEHLGGHFPSAEFPIADAVSVVEAAPSASTKQVAVLRHRRPSGLLMIRWSNG